MKTFIATTAAAVLLACPAFAAANCASKEIVTDLLAQKYEESRILGGHSAFNDLLEVWGNEDTGSWTVVKIRPDGKYCIVDQGSAFLMFDPEPEGDPA